MSMPIASSSEIGTKWNAEEIVSIVLLVTCCMFPVIIWYAAPHWCAAPTNDSWCNDFHILGTSRDQVRMSNGQIFLTASTFTTMLAGVFYYVVQLDEPKWRWPRGAMVVLLYVYWMFAQHYSSNHVIQLFTSTVMMLIFLVYDGVRLYLSTGAERGKLWLQEGGTCVSFLLLFGIYVWAQRSGLESDLAGRLAGGVFFVSNVWFLGIAITYSKNRVPLLVILTSLLGAVIYFVILMPMFMGTERGENRKASPNLVTPPATIYDRQSTGATK